MKLLVGVLLVLLAVPGAVSAAIDRLSTRFLIVLAVGLAALPAIIGSIVRGAWLEALFFGALGGIMLGAIYAGLEDAKQIAVPVRSKGRQ